MEEKEIDLRDYIEVILKRKWLIITIFLVAVITTAIVSPFMPKTYQTSGVIQIARVEKPIYSKEEAQGIILSQEVLGPVLDEFPEAFEERPLLSEFRKGVKIEDIKDTPYLKIQLQGEDPRTIQKMANSIVTHFFAYSRPRYKEELSLLKERLGITEKKIATAKSDIKDIESRVDYLSGKSSEISPETMSKIILLGNTLAGLKSNLNDYLDEEAGLKQRLITVKEFKVIDPPEVPERAIKPKKKQMVAISGVLSLMMGIFLAFFLEYWSSSKRVKE